MSQVSETRIPNSDELSSAAVDAQLFSACINSDGTENRGLGIVSAESKGTGWYEVVFNRNVSQGVYVASVGSPTATNVGDGIATVAPRSGNPYGVWIETRNSNGDLEDKSFYLMVTTA